MWVLAWSMHLCVCMYIYIYAYMFVCAQFHTHTHLPRLCYWSFLCRFYHCQLKSIAASDPGALHSSDYIIAGCTPGCHNDSLLCIRRCMETYSNWQPLCSNVVVLNILPCIKMPDCMWLDLYVCYGIFHCAFYWRCVVVCILTVLVWSNAMYDSKMIRFICMLWNILLCFLLKMCYCMYSNCFSVI